MRRNRKDLRPALFGWQAIPRDARTLAITEGEFDAVAFHEYGIAALSVPFGGGRGHKQDDRQPSKLDLDLDDYNGQREFVDRLTDFANGHFRRRPQGNRECPA